MIWFLFLVLVAGIAGFPFWQESRREKIGRDQRKGAPGSYARLSNGVTYYRWFGPARGPVIVAIHGLTTPAAVWNVIGPGLGALGYRVLTYDLYGRGLSDAPKGAQDAAFFSQQLLDLMQDQGLDDDVVLMGYSMGGSIAAAFAAKHPHRVSRLILIAAAGIDVVESGFSRFCRQVPYLGDWLFLAVAPHRARRDIMADTTQSEVPEISDIQLQQLSRRGFLPAVLSSRRGMLRAQLEVAHRKVGSEDIDVIAIWGARDAVIPMSALGQLAQWNRLAKQEVITEAGHGLPYTHGSEIVSTLRSVLAEQP